MLGERVIRYGAVGARGDRAHHGERVVYLPRALLSARSEATNYNRDSQRALSQNPQPAVFLLWPAELVVAVPERSRRIISCLRCILSSHTHISACRIIDPFCTRWLWPRLQGKNRSIRGALG